MKIVFRSSNVNKAYTINYQVQDVNTGSTTHSGVRNTNVMVVTPRTGYIIDAKDFIHGLLPEGIGSVRFTNSSKTIDYSNQVLVNVGLSGKFSAIGKDNIVFDIPISGVGKFPANKVELNVRIPENNDIIQSTVLGTKVQTSDTSIAHGFKSIKYTLEGKRGLKILLFQKTFKAFEGSYFVSPPTCKLNANQRNRYEIRTFNEYGENKRVITRKISVYYTFPTENFNSVDHLSITAAVSKFFAKKKDKDYAKSLQPTIYSFQTIGSAGPLGGIVPVEVRGTPGTPFRIAIENAAKQIYDQQQGAFVTGGRFLEGIIPGGNNPIGVYRTNIQMPSVYTNNSNAANNNYVADTTKGNSVEMRLLSNKETKTDIPNYKDKREGYDSVDKTTVRQFGTTNINFFIDTSHSEYGTDGGSSSEFFTQSQSLFRKQDLSSFEILETTTLTAGSGQDSCTIPIFGVAREPHPYIYNFEYVIEPASGTYAEGWIRIVRQPRFLLYDGKVNTNTAYRAWNCSSSATAAKTCSDANTKVHSHTTGTELEIYNDFFASTPSGTTENNYGAVYRINVKAKGIGNYSLRTGDASGDSTLYKHYKKVILTGSISGITFPTEKLEIQLKLQNFLTLQAP